MPRAQNLGIKPETQKVQYQESVGAKVRRSQCSFQLSDQTQKQSSGSPVVKVHPLPPCCSTVLTNTCLGMARLPVILSPLLPIHRSSVHFCLILTGIPRGGETHSAGGEGVIQRLYEAASAVSLRCRSQRDGTPQQLELVSHAASRTAGSF